MELLQNLSDDQFALVSCTAALFVTGGMMSLSYYIGRWRRFAPGRHAERRGDEARRLESARESEQRTAA